MILSYIQNLEKIWIRKGYSILFISSILFLLFGSFYMYIKNKKGTWETREDINDILYSKIYNIPKNKINEKSDERTTIKESKGEKECKRVLEKLFNKPFNKVRPDFLKNQVTGNTNNLELDCYNEELKIGLEYNGRQHYEFIPYFHRNKETFYNQKYRDELKRIKCRDNGIILIEVPYNIKIHEIERYIITELKKNV